MKQTRASFSAREAANFRLSRHHLIGDQGTSIVSLCRDICGAQAQLMTAGHLQLWTRNHVIRREEVEAALWQKRTLVKTHLMRQTLHLIPSADFALYISALKSCRVADALRIMRRFGISDEEGHSLTPLILDALSQGPMNRAAITAAVRPKVSKRVQAWMAKVWSIVRIPMAEGLLCYGPGEENEVTLTRTADWLGKRRTLTEQEARAELLRRYLGAYGPATISDFAHWAGMPAGQARPLPALLGEELCEISLDGRACLLLRQDLAALHEASTLQRSVRLLPHFDPYLLAHREKDHLLSSRHYKRVYRNQGWISPVVLINGAIAAVWSYKTKASGLEITVEPFTKLARDTRQSIAQEAEALAGFFNSNLKIDFRNAT